MRELTGESQLQMLQKVVFTGPEFFSQEIGCVCHRGLLSPPNSHAPMVSTLEPAEALIHVLAFLLQIFVRQLERTRKRSADPWTSARDDAMMQQIQAQKVALESLNNEVIHQKRSPECSGRSPVEVPILMATGSSSGVMPATGTSVIQRRQTPSVTSQASSWQELEEVEEILAREKI
eukprot:s859_g13.t1